MRYASIDKCEYTNGEGIGVSLFVQGCHFHCKNCFNPETWDFTGGNLWNGYAENKLIEYLSRPYVDRLTILGGEPLCDENISNVYILLLKIREKFPEKQIWIYTGYEIDSIFEKAINDENSFDVLRASAILLADVIVDGQFEHDKVDTYNKHIIWAGSYNQRVIDIPQFKNNVIQYIKENNCFARNERSDKNGDIN